MAVTDYASIRTELNNFTERSYTTAQVDTFIGLGEADFNLYLGPNYVRETSATINTDANGVASLPAGFVTFKSCVHATVGPLSLVTWDELARYNPLAQGGIPARCAISGSQIKTAPVFDGDLTLNFEGTLAPLTSGNTTNWLLDQAPQAYFWMVMAQAKASEEDEARAAAYQAKAMQTIRDLGIQSMVAQFGRASYRARGVTP